jgi:hypothetical protein
MNLDFLQNLPHEDRTSIRLSIPFTTSGSHSQPPIFRSDRLLKNAHLRRFPYPSPLNVHQMYASRLRISGTLHPGIFEQPPKEINSTGCRTGGLDRMVIDTNPLFCY